MNVTNELGFVGRVGCEFICGWLWVCGFDWCGFVSLRDCGFVSGTPMLVSSVCGFVGLERDYATLRN